MKNILFLLFVFLSAGRVNRVWSQEGKVENTAVSISVGNEFNAENILNRYQMQEQYNNLKTGDTLSITFTSEVSSVCKNKGCWMKVVLEDGREVMVKFKNYAFFVPKDIKNQTVVVSGLAYVEVMTVQEQRHYAQDAGKSTEEIEAIVEPQKTLSFIADGVRIKK